MRPPSHSFPKTRDVATTTCVTANRQFIPLHFTHVKWCRHTKLRSKLWHGDRLLGRERYSAIGTCSNSVHRRRKRVRRGECKLSHVDVHFVRRMRHVVSEFCLWLTDPACDAACSFWAVTTIRQSKVTWNAGSRVE